MAFPPVPQATPEMVRLIAAVDRFSGSWQRLRRLEPERLSRLHRVATIESIASSTRIEGSSLTDREVEALLGRIEVGSFASRDEQEVRGCSDLLDLIYASWGEIRLTEDHIRHLHQVLLGPSSKDERHRAHYKTAPNSVAAFAPDERQLGVVFETATPLETPLRMAELVAWHAEQEQLGVLHPLLVIGAVVVAFLKIHPFQDGNGRLSRALTTLLLLRAGYDHIAYSSLEGVIERNKNEYYVALRRTQGPLRGASPDWTPWLTFFLRSLHEQSCALERKVDMERAMTSELPALSAAILDLAETRGRVTMAEAVAATGASRNTLKLHFRRLAERQLLELHGRGRSAWYERT